MRLEGFLVLDFGIFYSEFINILDYSTVTDFAKFRGWSTFLPNNTAMWYESNCRGIVVSNGDKDSKVFGTSITWSAKSLTCVSPSVTTAMIFPFRAFIS